MIYIKNISGSEQTFRGAVVADGAYKLIAESERSDWYNDSSMFDHISNDEALIAKSDDGSNDITDKALGWNTLGNLVPANVAITGKSVIQNAIPVINYKPEDSSFTMATHDFCNKTTWYSKSVRVTDETLTTSDDLTYTAANDYFINVVDGIVNRQDLHQDKAIEVKVDDVVTTIGYTIDHTNGTVTFATAQTGKTVKCSYNYATTSEWVMTPETGKLLIIEHSEVQFAKNVEISTPLRFEIWVYNPYDLPNKILYSYIQYNSIRDLINEANLGTGYIPKMGDMPDDILVFPFNYISVKPFQSSVGAELRIKSVDDEELTGSYGTATFYLISRSDS